MEGSRVYNGNEIHYKEAGTGHVNGFARESRCRHRREFLYTVAFVGIALTLMFAACLTIQLRMMKEIADIKAELRRPTQCDCQRTTKEELDDDAQVARKIQRRSSENEGEDKSPEKNTQGYRLQDQGERVRRQLDQAKQNQRRRNRNKKHRSQQKRRRLEGAGHTEKPTITTTPSKNGNSNQPLGRGRAFHASFQPQGSKSSLASYTFNDSGAFGPWKVEPWAKNFTNFNLTEDGTEIIVNRSGLYLLYSQVTFHTTQYMSTYQIQVFGSNNTDRNVSMCYSSNSSPPPSVNDRKTETAISDLLKCLTEANSEENNSEGVVKCLLKVNVRTSPEDDEKEARVKSCFTSTIVKLEHRDRIQMYIDGNTTVNAAEPIYNFIGLFRINPHTRKRPAQKMPKDDGKKP